MSIVLGEILSVRPPKTRSPNQRDAERGETEQQEHEQAAAEGKPEAISPGFLCGSLSAHEASYCGGGIFALPSVALECWKTPEIVRSIESRVKGFTT